ncbi:MAG: superoxide dismutase family protein [Solirubrobacteraceae bacterium]
MHRFRRILVLLGLLTLGAATVAFAGPGRGDDDRRGHRGDRAAATLVNAEGERVGRAWFRERGRDGSVFVFAQVQDLPPGFHGFHIHTTGACEPDFGAAGGHFNPAGADHGDHAGDQPTLLVMEDGTGVLAFATDRYSIDDLRDDDGSAVMVHELADNYANIPERYGGPDEETLATGDAGSRLACGEVR